jgi:hypothetical protein
VSERGVFAVDRGIWDHDLLTDSEPFSRREAWLWLVSEAAWRPHRRRIIGRQFELSRGQLVASTRFIASKWRWSEARVRRFLAALISEDMIGAKTDAGVSVITICKYDEYQRVSLPSDAMRESNDDAGATQERRKVEDREYKELDDADASRARPQLIRPEAFKLADEIAGLCGHDLQFVPPEWHGAPLRVEVWLAAEWPREIILAAVKGALAKKRGPPPSSINYFEKPIAEAVAKASAPLPKVNVIPGETFDVRAGQGPSADRSVVAAAHRLVDRLREWDAPTGCGEGGGNVARLLPAGGRGGP